MYGKWGMWRVGEVNELYEEEKWRFQNHVDGKSGGDKSHVSQSPRPEAEVDDQLGKNFDDLLLII